MSCCLAASSVIMASGLSYLVKLSGGRNTSLGGTSNRILEKLSEIVAGPAAELIWSGNPFKFVARQTWNTAAPPSLDVTIASCGSHHWPATFLASALSVRVLRTRFVNRALELIGAYPCKGSLRMKPRFCATSQMKVLAPAPAPLPPEPPAPEVKRSLLPRPACEHLQPAATARQRGESV